MVNIMSFWDVKKLFCLLFVHFLVSFHFNSTEVQQVSSECKYIT